MPKSIKELSASEVEQVAGGATQVQPEITLEAPMIIFNDSEITTSITDLPGSHKKHNKHKKH